MVEGNDVLRRVTARDVADQRKDLAISLSKLHFQVCGRTRLSFVLQIHCQREKTVFRQTNGRFSMPIQFPSSDLSLVRQPSHCFLNNRKPRVMEKPGHCSRDHYRKNELNQQQRPERRPGKSRYSTRRQGLPGDGTFLNCLFHTAREPKLWSWPW